MTHSLTNGFANHYGYSDVSPFEVLRVISDKTIEVREMQATKDDSVKLEFHVGGFSANCSNQRQQKWNIAANPEGRTVRIRLNKNGMWKDSEGRKFKLNNQPIKFYDYNF